MTAMTLYAAAARPSGELSGTGPELTGVQLRPDNIAEVAAFTGGQQVLINGGPAVLLTAGGVVGLGDVAVREATADPSATRAEPADGFYTRYVRLSDQGQ